MTAQTQALGTAEFLLYSEDKLSLDAVTLASGENLSAGAVVGAKTKRQAAAPIPTIVGTGTGLMSALSFGPDVKVGSYVITLLATSATAAFSVVGPGGVALANGAVGTAYSSSHLSFLISNGGTMTTGDSYTVVVTAAGTPVLVGTGTGTVSGVSLGQDAQLGTYRVQLLATSATAEFEVIAPNGSKLKRGQVATAYTSSHVNFTLANGGTMTTGDYFNIIVATHTGQVVAWDPTATDGSQEPAGILYAATNATSAATPCTIVARLAEVEAALLSWKSGVSAAAQAVCKTRLLPKLNILAR